VLFLIQIIILDHLTVCYMALTCAVTVMQLK